MSAELTQLSPSALSLMPTTTATTPQTLTGMWIGASVTLSVSRPPPLAAEPPPPQIGVGVTAHGVEPAALPALFAAVAAGFTASDAAVLIGPPQPTVRWPTWRVAGWGGPSRCAVGQLSRPGYSYTAEEMPRV